MTDRLSTSDLVDLVDAARIDVRRGTHAPLTLARLSDALHAGGWANLADRVSDISVRWRADTLFRRSLDYRQNDVCAALIELVASFRESAYDGLVCGTCGEREGSWYAKACCTPDNMVEV